MKGKNISIIDVNNSVSTYAVDINDNNDYYKVTGDTLDYTREALTIEPSSSNVLTYPRKPIVIFWDRNVSFPLETTISIFDKRFDDVDNWSKLILVCEYNFSQSEWVVHKYGEDDIGIDDNSIALSKIINGNKGEILGYQDDDVLHAIDIPVDNMIVGSDNGVIPFDFSIGGVSYSKSSGMTINGRSVSNAQLSSISQGFIKKGGVGDAPTDLSFKTEGALLVGQGDDFAEVAISKDIRVYKDGRASIVQTSESESGKLYKGAVNTLCFNMGDFTFLAGIQDYSLVDATTWMNVLSIKIYNNTTALGQLAFASWDDGSKTTIWDFTTIEHGLNEMPISFFRVSKPTGVRILHIEGLLSDFSQNSNVDVKIEYIG